MLKILWKRGKIAPEEQFLPLSTIFYYLMLDFYDKTGIRFSLRDKRLFEITEVEITRVDCIYIRFNQKLNEKSYIRAKIEAVNIYTQFFCNCGTALTSNKIVESHGLF